MKILNYHNGQSKHEKLIKKEAAEDSCHRTQENECIRRRDWFGLALPRGACFVDHSQGENECYISPLLPSSALTKFH